MDPPPTVIIGTKGETVCWPTTFSDIARFFAFNYGLHVFTIIAAPGSGVINSAVTATVTLFMPFSGILTALRVVTGRFKRGFLDDLHTAHRAGALCMAVPQLPVTARSAQHVDPLLTNIHGQYPWPRFANTLRHLVEDIPIIHPPGCDLIMVPESFTITALPNPGPRPFRLAYNFSVLKTLAGIIQVVNGSLGLYHASERQFAKFGYAAYSLTVIPYILMSLINLLASLCEPQYPSMFLVLYRGMEQQPAAAPGTEPPRWPDPVMWYPPSASVELAERQSTAARAAAELAASNREAALAALATNVSGAVGEAFGDLAVLDSEEIPDADTTPVFLTCPATPPDIFSFVGLGWLLCVVVTFVTIYRLTGFEKGESSASQRGWLMAWLVFGQCLGPTVYMARANFVLRNELHLLMYMAVYGVPSMGGLIVVSRMIARDEMCIVI